MAAVVFATVVLLVAIAALIAMSGCVAMPMPAKTRIEGARGPTTLEVKAFRSGETPRAEVEKKLEGMRIPIAADGMVWARYTKSSSAWVWAIAAQGGAGAGAERNWGVHNLFATFDADGKLALVRDVNENQLHGALREYLKSGAIDPPDLSEEVMLEVLHRHARGGDGTSADVKMFLGRDRFALEEYYSDKHSFHIKPHQLLELSPVGFTKDSKPYSGTVLESLRFTDEQGKEHRWSVYVAAKDLPTLLRYWDEVAGKKSK